MIEEVRRQFKEYKLLEKNPTRPPDYAQCVSISTKAALIEMIIPGILAICSPLVCGFMLAIFMANAGGAWDNAKKWIEANGLGEGKGKNTKYHKAAVVGDTIGDPFKDTSGPALNILIKLMTMISLVFGKNVFKGKGEFDDGWFVGLIITGVFSVGAIGLTLWMRDQGFGKIKDMDKDGDE